MIDLFLQKYCNLPHIKLLANDTIHDAFELSKGQCWTNLTGDKSLIITAIILIISSIYQHINIMYKKMNNIDSNLFKQLKVQRLRFHRYIYKYNTNTSYKDRVWNLVSNVLDRDEINGFDNRLQQIRHNQQLVCAGCYLKQKNLKKKLKMCTGCELAYYCSKKCQKYDWVRHKHREICKTLQHSLKQ